jgi:NitT/TauT family transport system permease protein
MQRLKVFIESRTAQNIGWFLVIAGIWELGTRFGDVPPYILPSFIDVVVNLWNELWFADLGVTIINSMKIIAVGFLGSVALCVIIAMLCYRFKSIKSLFSFLCTMFNPLPSIAILPLVIMWFGIRTEAIFILIMHGVIWTLMRHLIDGMDAIPRSYREWGKNIQLGMVRVFTSIVFPAIMPDFISGVRIAWGRAWRALIGAEIAFGMIGSSGGLGFYINHNRNFSDIKSVMGGVLIVILISVIIESLIFKNLERQTIKKWHAYDD